MIETAAEREKRRTREPELEWEELNSDNYTIYQARTNRLGYLVEHFHLSPPWSLTIEELLPYKDDLGWYPGNIIHYKDLDQAKQAAHEHWRENGYE